MSLFKTFRRGRYFLDVLGHEFADEEPLSIEQFYVVPIEARGPRQLVATVGLTTSRLHIALMSEDVKCAVQRKAFPLDLISWIDLDARNPDYPWVLDSSGLEGPLELSSVGHGALLPGLLVGEMTKLERAVVVAHTSRQKLYIEYFPWRPHTPGSWLLTRTSDADDPAVEHIVNEVQAAYRNGSLAAVRCIADYELQHVPAILDERMAAHAHCVAAGMAKAQSATVGMDDGGNPCLVAVNAGAVAVSQLYQEPDAARGRPLTTFSALHDIDVRMGLYASDLNTMYLKFDGYPHTVRIEFKGLGDEWEALVAKAASTPAPSTSVPPPVPSPNNPSLSRNSFSSLQRMSRLGLRRPRPDDSEDSTV